VYPDLGRANILTWGWQLEASPFPTSYIPRVGNVADRLQDRLSFAPERVPAWMREGVWQFDVYPIFASSQVGRDQGFTLFAWDGGFITLSRSLGSPLGAYVSIGYFETARVPIQWQADQRITITIDVPNRKMFVSGGMLDREQSVDIPRGLPIARGLLDVGSNGGWINAFARISEPRRVASRAVDCQPDHDCVVCGDGLVTGGEVCDPASNARCAGNCANEPGLTPCTSNARCPLAQACPDEPNGLAFGAAEWRRFCVPTFVCLTGNSPSCGEHGSAACGACDCTPQCDGKQCGDPADDGCGGRCTGFCRPGEAGPALDSDCPPGYVVGIGEGWRFGGVAGSNVCWPAFCEDDDEKRIPCGAATSPCGLCDPSIADECFLGPLCDKPAGENCSPGKQFGNEIGVCVPNSDAPAEEVTTSAVGALPGTFNVGSSGSATFTIPINVPPGRGGLAPALALSYASGSGNSTVGLDWHVSGFSSISVCSKSVAQDGVLHYNDAGFCLDGQRLIPLSHTGGDPGVTTFRTEFDTFTKFHAAGNFISGWNRNFAPPVFVAQQGNGTVLVYGDEDGESAQLNGSTDSEWNGTQTGLLIPTRSWALSQVTDRAGNTIEIKYSKRIRRESRYQSRATVDVELVPRWIGYNFAGEKDGDAVNEIVFTYVGEGEQIPADCFADGEPADPFLCRGLRSDSLEGYAFGYPVSQTHLLESVNVFAVGKKVRSYKLWHDGSNFSNLSLLKRVTECVYSTAGVESCRSPAVFDYAEMERLPFGPSVPGPTPANAQWMTLDWNGDGFDDAARYDGRRWHVYVGSAAGLSTRPSVIFQSARENDFAGPDGYEIQHAFVMDLDGDGANDVLLAGKDAQGRLALDRFEQSIQSSPVTLPWPPGYPGTAGKFVQWDSNGDGLPDLLYCSGDGNRWKNFVNRGGGQFGQPDDVLQTGYCDNAQPVNTQDGRTILVFDGGAETFLALGYFHDGLNAAYTVQPTGLAVNPRRMQLRAAADMNGDGLRDLLFTSYDAERAYFEVWFNTGSVRGASSWKLASHGENALLARADSIAASDFDLDGRTDILAAIHLNDGRTQWLGYMGGPDGPRHAPQQFATIQGTHPAPEILDANGDGRMDYLGGGRYFVGVSPAANLLTKVRQPTHAHDVPTEIRITYAAGAARGVYTAGSGFECDGTSFKGRCMRTLSGAVVHTVESRQFKQSAADPRVLQTEKLTYSYTDGRADMRGRGWIGFKLRRVIKEGVGGAELTSTTEHYDLSPRDEGATGPFFALNPGLGAAYHYYYYPFASKPWKVESLYEIPQNDLTRDDVSYGLVQGETSFEVKTSDAGLRFLVVKSEDTRTYEGPGIVDHSHVEYTYDQFSNLKSVFTTWPLESGRMDAAVYTYKHETEPVLVQAWQLDLVASSLTGSTASVAGPGQSIWRSVEFWYYPNYLLKQKAELLPSRSRGLREELVTAFAYDARNNVNRIEQYGWLNREVRTESRFWEYEYDSTAGVYVSEAQNPEGHFSRTASSYRDGLVRVLVDPNLVHTTRSYDGFGRLVQENQQTAGVVTTLTYEPSSFDGTQILPRNAAFKVTTETRDRDNTMLQWSQAMYDTQHRKVADRRPGFTNGVTLSREYEYDRFGRLWRASRLHPYLDSSQGVVTYGYDTLGRRTSHETPDHRVTRIFYASVGSSSVTFDRPDARWIVATENARGYRYHRVSDARGNVILSSDPITTMEYEYGAADFLLATSDEPGNRTVRVPDSIGRLASGSDPDTGAYSYTYNPWSELVAQVQNNEHTEFQLDKLGRIIGRDDRDGHTSWTYDEITINGTVRRRDGELMRATSPRGHVDTYSYGGPAGLLDRVDRRVVTPRGAIDLAARFTYDGMLRRKTVEYPGAGSFAVEYRYSPTGYLESVVNPSNPDETFWQVEQVYAGYRPQKVRLGNGVSQSMTFDPLAGWLDGMRTDAAEAGDPAILDITLDRDENGNVTAARKLHDPTESIATHYVYDELDRLEDVKRGPGDNAPVLAHFDYTPTGNLKTKTGMGTYIYGADGQPDTGPQTHPHFVRRVTGPSGTHTYTPDAFGRVALRTGLTVPLNQQSFIYTATGQLRRVNTGGGSPQAHWQEFEYSAGGERVLKKSSDGSQEVRFSSLYEQVWPARGQATELFRVFVGSQAVAEVRRPAAAPAETTYLHRNHLGSVEAITDEDGTVVERRSYGAFGETSDVAAGESSAGYTGHRMEADMGLVDMSARFYDANLGRFLAPDPTIPAPGFSQAYNRYSYVYNNPLSLIDPTGYAPEDESDPSEPPEYDPEKDSRPDKKPEGVTCGPLCIPAAVVTAGAIVAYFGIKDEWAGGKVKDFFSKDGKLMDALRSVGDALKKAVSWIPGVGGSDGGGGDDGSAKEPDSGGRGTATGIDVASGAPLGNAAGSVASAPRGPTFPFDRWTLADETPTYFGNNWWGHGPEPEVAAGTALFPAAPAMRLGGALAEMETAFLGRLPAATAAPAARQIEAAWSVSKYRHGGLMSGMEHIMYRHSAKSGFANVSRFAEGTTARNVVGYVDDALRHGTVKQTGASAFTIEHNLGRAIGTNIAGESAISIRVFVRDGVIQTAFPF
jgi:RHS repeat-associated protein